MSSRRADRAVFGALILLVVAGIGLRLLLLVARTPGFLGYGDGGAYVGAAHDDLFGPPTWPAGYPLVLRVAHMLVPNLSAVMLVQHLLGVATALLLFVTVRRVAPAVWALLPAAVVLLAGPVLFLEHAPLSEPLFAFLAVASCYCAVRALDEPRLTWALAAGLLAAMAACVRSVGILLPIAIVGWLVVADGRGLRERLRPRLRLAATAAVAAWLVLAAYVVTAKHEAGYVGPGLVRNGGVNLYAGVATFADCTRFTPPSGTRALCDRRPPALRPGPRWYVLDERSPVARAYGSLVSVRPNEDAELSAFARAAIVHQPLDFVGDIGGDLTRFWASDRHHVRFPDESYDTITTELLTVPPPLLRLLHGWYATGDSTTHAGPLRAARGYERHTRLEGPPFALLVLLALAGLPLARGRRLAVGCLLGALSLITLIGPLAFAFFNARYVVPGYGPLAATAAIGAASLWERAAAWAARRRHGSIPARSGVAA